MACSCYWRRSCGLPARAVRAGLREAPHAGKRPTGGPPDTETARDRDPQLRRLRGALHVRRLSRRHPAVNLCHPETRPRAGEARRASLATMPQVTHPPHNLHDDTIPTPHDDLRDRLRRLHGGLRLRARRGCARQYGEGAPVDRLALRILLSRPARRRRISGPDLGKARNSARVAQGRGGRRPLLGNGRAPDDAQARHQKARLRRRQVALQELPRLRTRLPHAGTHPARARVHRAQRRHLRRN